MTADQRERTPVPPITLDEYEFDEPKRQEFLASVVEADGKGTILPQYRKLLDNPPEKRLLVEFFKKYDAYSLNSALGHLILLISAERKIKMAGRKRRNGFSSGEVELMRRISGRRKAVVAAIVTDNPHQNFAEELSLVFYGHIGTPRVSRENRDRGLDVFMRNVTVVFPSAKRRIGE